MGSFNIVSARPKGSNNHLNSQFKLYVHNQANNQWFPVGWKSIGYINDLIQAGNIVCTGKIENGKMYTGDVVEFELRIAHNRTNFKISSMPDT